MFKQFFLNYFKRQFNDNPLVTQTADYLPKVGHAMSVWLGLVLGLLVLTFIGIFLFMLGVIFGLI